MQAWIFLLLLLLAVLILLIVKQLWSKRHFPPGPFPLPLIGSLWVIGTGIREDTLIKLAKQYGKMYTVWMGSQPVVVLSGLKTVKEGMTSFSGEFSDRMVTPFLSAFGREMGIIFSNGHTWEQQRRIGIISLRKLGVGKKSIEHQIQEGSRGLVEQLTNTKGQPFDPYFPLINSATNVICALSFGYQFALEDENFLKLTESINYLVNFSASFFHLLYEMLPWLMKNLPGPHKKALYHTEFIISLAKQEIEKHKNYHSLHEPQDFIDYYLLEIEKSRDDSSTTYNEENLAQCIQDFFLAGTETTFATMMWILLILTNHPNIQEKVQKEIEDVFGSSDSISYKDRKKLPYTNAVIHEIQRIKYITLFGIPRQSRKDMKMGGFHIPKGAIVVPNLHSVLLDPEEWETPEEFNPNHFLDKDGNFKAREAFLPFGIGARVCVGEELARTEIFITITSLLKAFNFQLPEGVKELNEKPVVAMSMHPHSYKICAVPHQASS